jgi:hypothetical protein
VYGILNGKNDCAGFFNNMASAFVGGSTPSAAGLFQTDNIQFMHNDPFVQVAAFTTQGTGANSTINVNINSPWTFPVRVVNGHISVFNFGFVSSSPQGHTIELMHEFAHTINLMSSTIFPPDGGNQAQSTANTNTIIQKCGATVQNIFEAFQ